MKKQIYRLMPLFTFCLIAVLTLPAGAAVIEHDGWLYGEEADAAIEQAKEYNVPIAIMRTYRETTCPKCIGAARLMATSKSTKKMVRVMLYVGAGSDGKTSDAVSSLFNQTRGDAKNESNWIPDLYFVMPDGRSLGFVNYEEAAKTESEAKAVAQIAEWIKSVDKTLEKADRDAAKGRFDAALKAIDKIVEQDAQISHLIQQQLGQIEEKAEMPETPVSPMFDGLKDEKIAKYQAQAMEKIAQARELIDNEELREAQRLLRTLARTPEGFEAKAAAEEMMDEVIEKLKAS